MEAFSLKVYKIKAYGSFILTKESFVYNFLVLYVIVRNFVHFIVLCTFKVITNLFDIHPQVKETAENVDDALRELPDANLVTCPDHQYPLKSSCIQFFS